MQLGGSTQAHPQCHKKEGRKGPSRCHGCTPSGRPSGHSREATRVEMQAVPPETPPCPLALLQPQGLKLWASSVPVSHCAGSPEHSAGSPTLTSVVSCGWGPCQEHVLGSSFEGPFCLWTVCSGGDTERRLPWPGCSHQQPPGPFPLLLPRPMRPGREWPHSGWTLARNASRGPGPEAA